MYPRRKALKLLLGGIAACAGTPVFAAPEIAVYHSPD